ncbi:MAG: hypothetical protein LBV22_02760 [Mycoplasmataceae bacterium]|nr:hypothetical protein [Mycoplasmataceae bacterium]
MAFNNIAQQPIVTENEAAWEWLGNLIGDGAANAVTTVFDIAVYGIVLYIIVIQVVRLLNNFNNRNAEDAKTRQEARENIKGSVFIIIMVALIGGVGFSALTFLVLNGDFGLGTDV